MGFVGPERGTLLGDLGVRMTERGTVWRDENWMTSEDAVFTAGDMQRGQSLIVWAIADGRSAAHHVDAYLMGRVARCRSPATPDIFGPRLSRSLVSPPALQRADDQRLPADDQLTRPNLRLRQDIDRHNCPT